MLPSAPSIFDHLCQCYCKIELQARLINHRCQANDMLASEVKEARIIRASLHVTGRLSCDVRDLLHDWFKLAVRFSGQVTPKLPRYKGLMCKQDHQTVADYRRLARRINMLLRSYLAG